MPLTFEPTEFLSYIDPEIPPTSRRAIISLIHSERSPEYASTLHPSIPASYEPNFGPFIEAEHERIAAKLPRPDGSGIDLSRYEADALEAPPRTSPHSDEERPETLRQWRETLQRAYASSTYLSSRLTNLSLLETYGKNAWLIGNSQLEQIWKDLEGDLAEAKKAAEVVEEERRFTQEGVRAEIDMLDQSWKRGIRGIVEVEVATEELRQKILERRRAGVGG